VAVLVTRPHPDNEATAAALRARGFEVLLAPMLRFEPMAFADDGDAHYDGIIVTSANALRAIDGHRAKMRLLDLPLFAVGEHSADAARDAGFRDVIAGDGGAAALPNLIDKRFTDKRSGKKAAARERILLYLAGADITRDLSADLGERGFSVVTQTTYKMSPISRLPRAACDAFAADRVDAILHYSQRSARAFIAAARADGVEISALALPQCCLSDAVAVVMRDAGAAHVMVARAPDEQSMLDAVDRVRRAARR
jgi:uroporphyrinogen-III synthase